MYFMKIHELKVEQILPVDLQTAWNFFSSPLNLDLITPEDMSFQILSGATEKTYAGQIITYKIRPILNLPMNWVTEITNCEDYRYFIDEQRFGPYRFWHHQHHFSAHPEGVLMKDILHYGLPFGIFGEIMGGLFIHKKVRGIFDYREIKLNELFSKKNSEIAA